MFIFGALLFTMETSIEAYHSYLTAPPPGATVWVNNAGLITGAGNSQYWWKRDYVCLHIVMGGQGRIETEYGAADVSRGDMFCLWPGVAISYGKRSPHSWQVHWAHLSGPGDVDFGRACGFGETCVTRRPIDAETACDRFRELFLLFREKGDRNPHRVLQILHGIAEACRGEEAVAAPVQRSESMLVARARRILDYELHAGLNVSELADRLGVSRTALFLAFRDELNTTPIEFLTRVRLGRAKQLLLHTEYTLDVIAAMVGFSHPKSFLKRFRQQEGIPPGSWRLRNKPPTT